MNYVTSRGTIRYNAVHYWCWLCAGHRIHYKRLTIKWPTYVSVLFLSISEFRFQLFIYLFIYSLWRWRWLFKPLSFDQLIFNLFYRWVVRNYTKRVETATLEFFCQNCSMMKCRCDWTNHLELCESVLSIKLTRSVMLRTVSNCSVRNCHCISIHVIPNFF